MFGLGAEDLLLERGVAEHSGEGVEQRSEGDQRQEDSLDDHVLLEVVELEGEVEEVDEDVGHPGAREDHDVQDVADVQLLLVLEDALVGPHLVVALDGRPHAEGPHEDQDVTVQELHQRAPCSSTGVVALYHESFYLSSELTVMPMSSMTMETREATRPLMMA